jgi:long-subunit fatty acid transport protein
MALTATVTKKSAIKTPDNRYDISFNLILTDDAVEVINADYSCRYKTGDNVSSKLAIIITDMQNDINKYKAQKTVFNSTVLNNAVTTIQNGLTV